MVLLAAILLGSSPAAADDPGARWGHTFVHDPHRGQIVLFGGARERGTYLADTWTWNGDEWTRHEVDGPSARGFAAATYHAGRRTVILHGGRGEDRRTHTDTWEWDGAGWNQLVSENEFAADHHRMVYIPDGDRIMAFGGWTGDGVSGETWIWNGHWTRSDAPSPPARAAFGMAYAQHIGQVVLFGGMWIDGQYADIWTWQDGIWKQRGGPYDNSSLDHHAMVYDAGHQQLIVAGGKNYRYVAQNRTLTVTGSTVESLATEGPSPRHSIGLAYDDARGRVLLYGGKEYEGSEQIPRGDFWSWDGTNWTEIHP